LANTSINLVDLDFNSLKINFKNYLRENPQFKDYDYDGSNINILLELLAYNTFKNAFYTNMALSEGFLDSAQSRNSVMSHAKELNYLPKSPRSAKARVKIVFEADGTSAPYTVTKGSPLTSLVRNESYTFTIPENFVVASANNTYEFETDIFEGIFVQDTFTFLDEENQRFRISNRNIDTTSITVNVFEDSNEVSDVYVFASSLLDLNSLDKVYFLQSSFDGYYELIFGDNNLGKRPALNSTIVVEYRVASGEEPNGAQIFTLDFDPTGNDELLDTPEVNTLENAKAGAEEETIESIKFIAPRHFQVQERAVTAQDYEILLRAQFPEIVAVHAYGGEELSPPLFGKVFVAVDLDQIDGLPESKITEYTNFIKNRTTFGIVPVFIEPEFTYLQISSNIRYNINITSDSSETVKSDVITEIQEFRDEFLNDFNVVLRHSKLETTIDQAHPSIVSSATKQLIYKKTNPTLATPVDLTIDFGVPLYNKLGHAHSFHPFRTDRAVSSSNFYYNSELATLEDDGFGKVRILRLKGDAYEKIIDIGTVDYDSGLVKIQNIDFDSYQGSSFKVYAKPRDPDVVVKKNNNFTIEDDEILITMEQIRE
jgi:hypothetical protein